MNKNSEIKEQLFSFNEIIKAAFLDIRCANFERTDTGEYLGSIWAKYPKHTKLSAIAYGGIIEFKNPNERYSIKVYGNEIQDLDAKIFRGY